MTTSPQLDAREFIEYLRLNFQWPLLNQFFLSKSVDALLDREKISVDQDEISNESAKFRKANGLIAESQLKPFLASRKISEEEFLQYFARVARLNKLKLAIISEKEIEQQFALRKSELDKAEIYRIVVTKESQARALRAEIQDGMSFFSLAKEQSQDRTAKQCGYCGVVSRREFRPEIEAAIFAAKPGDLLGPIKSAGQFHIVLVEQIWKAAFDEQTSLVLREELFQQWLQRQL